jgi:5'-3' exonuclease/transcription antitermination factor NusG
VPEWVVLELSSKADGEDPDSILASIHHQIKDAEIYLPVSVTRVGGDRVVNYLVDGYAFIKREHTDDRYFRLESTRYVQSIISRIGRGINGRPVRQIACAKDSDIERFRSQIHVEENQGIGVGDIVVVTSGPYRQIQATVIEDIPEKEEVSVHIKLRSKEDIVTLPRSFLRLVQRAAKSPYLDRVEDLRAWYTSVKPFLLGDERRLTRIKKAGSRFELLDQGYSRRQPLLSYFDVLRSRHDVTPLAEKFRSFTRYNTVVLAKLVAAPPLDPTPLWEHGRTLARLAGWDSQWKSLLPGADFLRDVLKRVYSSLPLDPIQARFVTLEYIEEVFERLGTMKGELDAIERSMSKGGGIDFLFVDGHNLVVRCASVPGLSDLTDKKGRHTGAILGTLRSLAGFHKRFSGAKIVVVWDGSSQRRKGMFVDYKSNRPAPNPAVVEQVRWLKDALPLLGVEQAWNPKEEADDIIATLVRQNVGKRCVIVSTDRDMLQLVSDTVRVYIPGKDKLYDSAAVESEYGVKPERMVDLRSFDGDSSDNIPGVSGFGPKTVARLLHLYGSVEGVYSSSFAGMTPTQYQKLRAAEKQVRLNVRLMSLHTDLPVESVCPNPDRVAAEARLNDVDVQSAPILSVLFGGG